MQFVGLFLSKSEKTPLYQQLYAYFVQGIGAGRIKAGEKLPGKRTAAAQLGVSVNTVDQAYQMLAAEGYVHARARSGFVVAKLEQQMLPRVAKENNTAQVVPQSKWVYSLATGDMDAGIFPRKTWNRIFREVLTREPDLFLLGESQGDALLREAIAEYLQGYRGVHCKAQQIVVGAGLEVLNGMLARLFVKGEIAVENPGYPKTTQVLRNMGMRVLPVAVDENGMRVDLLRSSGATIAYVTPSHQFPTGAVMPAGRRSELLHWAKETNGVLIEDDYDSEFRFDGRPLPSLQGMDSGQRVVYAGTFSRALAPGLRAAYLVLPPWLLQRWNKAYSGYACTVWRPEQHTLAHFMSEGHFSRSLNRMRLAYKQKRGALLAALRKHLPAKGYTIKNAHTGLYFVLEWPGENATDVAKKARQQGLHLRALAEFDLRAPEKKHATKYAQNALVLGYGGLPQAKAEHAVLALMQLL